MFAVKSIAILFSTILSSAVKSTGVILLHKFAALPVDESLRITAYISQ